MKISKMRVCEIVIVVASMINLMKLKRKSKMNDQRYLQKDLVNKKQLNKIRIKIKIMMKMNSH